MTSPVGYGAVATIMSSDPDLSIFRSFTSLNTRNLLYLQSELMSLETRLHELDTSADDIKKGNATWSTPRSWFYLHQENGEHLSTVLRIRELLEKYNTALQSQAWLLTLQKPSPRPWTNLPTYLQDHHHQISQTDAEFISQKHTLDCVALSSTAKKEPMFMFPEHHLFWLFTSKSDRERAKQSPLGFCSEGRIRAFVRLLAILASSILPLLSIVALYYIPTQTARLGAIVAFSPLCSAALSLLTDVKNADIMAATAVYAAVQVVFVNGSVTAGT